MQTNLAQPPPAVASAGQPALRRRADSATPGGCGDSSRSLATNGRALIEALANSRLYRDFEQAFCGATGLMVSLRPVEFWQLPFHGRKNENKVCAMMSRKSRSCGVCLQVQHRLSGAAARAPHSLTCPLGLVDAAVPVCLGEQLVGFLQTGQFFRRKPTAAQFERARQLLEGWGIHEDAAAFRDAYFGAPVLGRRQHESVMRLLGIFAQHLGMVSNQLMMRRQNAEPVVIGRAKDYILEHHGESLSLGQVAKAVNTSRFYFCKLFKRATGINFTDYLSRVRIERARNLLLNPSLRISEIAFEVGFQSLTHFNRVFKKIIGQSPTQYRAQLPT